MRLVGWLWFLTACAVPYVPKTEDDTDVVDTDPVAPTEDTDAPPDDPDPWDTLPDEDDNGAGSDSADTGCDPGDLDLDGIDDCRDNCDDVPNPLQANLDGDDEGDDCDLDLDGDSVPNDFDPWPQDPEWPGVASAETIYPHTSDSLFSFNVVTLSLNRVGAFRFNTAAGSVTDIAIDQFGVLYAITFTDLHICRPRDAQCRHLGALQGISNNGLTFVPPSALGGNGFLVGMGGTDWFVIESRGARWASRQLGRFDNQGTMSSGDAFSIEGVGTFASVQQSANGPQDDIVVLDPATGAIQSRICSMNQGPNYSQIWGLAGWTDGYIYAFDAGGDILRVDVATGTYARIDSTPHAWWGAGVRTVIPPAP